MMNVLVVDVGGTHIKILASGQAESRMFDSGTELTPAQMVAGVLELAADWTWDVVSIGYPGPVVDGRPTRDPHNLAPGWVGFDFAAAFGKPVRLLNDAAMQALGSYHGGRMLFLGLGTGLGSAMVLDGVVQPLELAHMPYRKHRTYEDWVGERGLDRLGKRRWRGVVAEVLELFHNALLPDYIVVGGGNAKKLQELPEWAVRGQNANAFRGGFLLWEHPSAGGPAEPRLTAETPAPATA